MNHCSCLSIQYSFAALINKPAVFLTQSSRDFFQVSQPAGKRLSINIAFRSCTCPSHLDLWIFVQIFRNEASNSK